MVLAALAAGLALGTKLTVAAPVAALALGAIAVAPRGGRGGTALVWAGGLTAGAGVWFLRDLVHSGSPLPWLGDVGGLDLPGPAGGFSGREPFSVAHYLFDGSWAVESDWILPALRDSFGVAWPVLVLAALVGGCLALAPGRAAGRRVVGGAALVGLAAYLVTPLGAAGEEGAPIGFALNLRYAVPSLALGLALLPLAPALRARPEATAAGLAALLVAVAVSANEATTAWTLPHTSVLAAAGLALAVVAAIAAAVAASKRGPVACAVVVALLAVVVAGRPAAQSYLDDRHRRGIGYGLGEAAAWAQDRGDERIALAGTSGAYLQYGFYGEDLSNRVQWLGREGDAGDFERIEDCGPWLAKLNDGDYDVAVTTSDVDLDRPTRLSTAPEREWLEGAGARVALEGAGFAVFEIDGPLPTGACAEAAPAPGDDG